MYDSILVLATATYNVKLFLTDHGFVGQDLLFVYAPPPPPR